MDFIFSFLIYFMVFWLVFKLGEFYGYFRIARGLANIKEIAEMLEQKGDEHEQIKDKVTIEEIDGIYYAFINDHFVGQGSTIDDAKKYVEQELTKKYKISSLELVSREK